ncbi:hypothetical protein EB001_12970 [bacterium]|nr:hypothetical protein [bacterium]
MNKKIIWGVIVVAMIAIVGVYLINKSSQVASPLVQDTTDTKEVSEWKIHKNTKEYKNIKDGYTFEYPTKLSLSTSIDGVNLTHSIPFENTDGGCDMVGNAKVSKTLVDFNVSISIVPGQIKPPYVDGTFSGGSLKGDWVYRGAEGCGQTVYYFPISGNRTLILTKHELQVLSPVVAPDVRNKVLAVPGVISYEESNKIIEEILSTLKFTK